MLHKLPALLRRRLSVSQRFGLLSFFCVLAITVLVCVASSAVLRRQLIVHDGAVIADLASRLFTSSVPADFFAVPSGAPPAGAERLREFARSEQVVRFMVYDTDGWVLWSDDPSLTDHHFGENTKAAAALHGEVIAEISHPAEEGHYSTLRGFPRLEEVYIPVRYQSSGPIVGVIELYRAPATLFAVLDHGVVVVWVLGGIAGAILYLTLVSVAWNCYRTQIRLEGELYEARVLYETTARFGELMDGDALLTAIVEGAVSLTRASYGGTGFPDGDDMVMHRLVAPEQRRVVRLKMAECLAGLSFTSGAPQVANDAAQDPRVNRASARSLGVRNLACVPLQHRGRVIGVLFVGNKEVGPFTEQDVVRLRAFAHHAAVALENARLLRETRNTKEYLENLIASSVDAIVTVDQLGRITFVSKGGQRMFGYDDGELIGRPVRALWACGSRDFRTFRTRLVRAGRVENYETELTMGTGARLVVNISASFLSGAAGEVSDVLAVVKDVTSLRRLHEQIVRSERLAAAGLLAAGVAHEVGNPLTCISSLAQFLMARASDPAMREGLENIEVHVDRISRIVQDLTRLTRPAPATLREASVGNLVDTAVNLARHNPAVRRMKMDSAVDPALPAVRVAPDHLVQVFLNLILNAADSGGHLTIRAVRTGGAIRVIFDDTGCGMTAEEMRRLFDPFHSTKDNETHLGLGLFVSHEIVMQHGGELLVESQPGVGSTVTVVLPMERLPSVSEELV
ncbi:MAG: PAS domain S-box protein [Betaproteobacteria bacterium]|nr:MAG: PAS domain S-box protein [Betaproteobacteria bacterium]